MFRSLSLVPLAILPLLVQAQAPQGLAQFPFAQSPLTIHHTAQAQQPFTVVSRQSAILGSQDGSFELWLMPVQILRNARLTARLQGYDATIDLNRLATDVEVAPDHTTVTYSHAAINVRQHMFLSRSADGTPQAIVLFEVHASRPAEISLSFDPSMTMQWPAPGFGPASASWVTRPGGSGYVLETNRAGFFGVVTIPGARHGDLRPYQERAEETPAVLTFSYTPGRDDHRFYPLLCGVSQASPADSALAAGASSPGQLLDRVLATAQQVPQLYQSTANYYAHFFDERFEADTPDAAFNHALRWAEVAVDQSRTPTADGIGMTAGWLPAGSTARPGYGWFFGRDTLWTLFAVDSYGDFRLSREALEFLLAHQRSDGKIMHELSQTAAWVDWKSTPYYYAEADSTPLLLLAADDYVRSSGDRAFLREHWQQLLLAYRFTRAHTSSGAMDNSQGTGWVEEWLPHSPDQEAYLVALDAQANYAFARLAAEMGDAALADEAEHTAGSVAGFFNSYRSPSGIYRFSRNRDGSYENVRSIFPSVAWWTGELHPADPANTFTDWESSHFTVDWGVRSVADDQPIYDPISYHHGSVWPLYTGWLAMAEYREHRDLAAWEHLRSDAALTWLQDPGAITELLSGEFYEPLARSSSHQLWSSAMLIAPAIRGLFGLAPDAGNRRLVVAPQLPAGWNHVSLRNVAVGTNRFRIHIDRSGPALLIDAAADTPTVLCLSAAQQHSSCTETAALHHTLRIPLPAVEVGIEEAATQEGVRSQHVRVINEQRQNRSLTLTLEAPAGSTQTLNLYRNAKPGTKLQLRAEGGELHGDSLVLHTPPGEGYQAIKTTIRW